MTDNPARHPDVVVEHSNVLHAGRIFRLLHERVRLPSGLVQEIDLVEHQGAVAIAARDTDGRLVLVRQYRHAVGGWTVEVPAGRLEAGEAPLATAMRELEEETGLRARSWTFLRTFVPSPGFCSERIHLFLAEELHAAEGEKLEQDADEEFDILRLSLAELAAGATADAKTLIAAACLMGALPAAKD